MSLLNNLPSSESKEHGTPEKNNKEKLIRPKSGKKIVEPWVCGPIFLVWVIIALRLSCDI